MVNLNFCDFKKQYLNIKLKIILLTREKNIYSLEVTSLKKVISFPIMCINYFAH